MASPQSSSSKSDFPRFADGDVVVVVSTTQSYKLHSQVLSTHSSFFSHQITSKPGPRLNAAARRDNSAVYRFEFVPASTDGEFGEFKRIDINETGRVVGPNYMSMLPGLDEGKVPNDTNRAWDWLFGIFYNRQPTFDDTSLATVLSCVMGLIECAESIGSIDHVRDVVDLALMRQDKVLWTSILGNSIVWIELGRRVRSPAIYSEAAIHLIGQWATISDADKLRIGQDIREILDRKATDLALAKEAIELRILGHYPQFMMRTAVDKPGRPSYANDIYTWMSVCFFRQWFAQTISDDRTRRAPDGGLNFYVALHEGGQAYLTHLDFQEFHRYFPMSIKACHVLEANMGVLKEDVKQFVADLMVERTHLKRAEHDINWLTCAKIEKADMPWIKPAGPGHADSLQPIYDDIENESAKLEAAKGKQKATRSVKTAGSGPGSRSGRAKKRARLEDDESAEEEGSMSDGLFVSENGSDGMEE